jgi:hypothetical protein
MGIEEANIRKVNLSFIQVSFEDGSRRSCPACGSSSKKKVPDLPCEEPGPPL